MKKIWMFSLLLLLGIFLLFSGLASASDKYIKLVPAGYAKSCSTCHSTIPKLNETGVKFQKAGHSFSFTKTPAPVTPAPAPKPVTTAPKPVVKPTPKPPVKPAPKPAASIYQQWTASKHNGVVAEAGVAKDKWPNARGGSYNCAKCHAAEGLVKYLAEVKAGGGYYATFSGKFGTTDMKNASITIKPIGPYADTKAVASCGTCHENGKLRIIGVVGLQTTAAAGQPGYDKPLMTVNAGKAAVCFTCHDYRKSPSFPSSLSDPSKVAIRCPHN
ncbi:MAG: hypothetical protein ACYC21_09715, partial [Eubacteriales bacterium]